MYQPFVGVQLRRLVVVAVVGMVVGACSGGGSGLDVGGGPLVYVAMGNSYTFEVIGPYSELLGAEFGVEVELRNHTVGGQRADELLELVLNDETLRSDIADAHVVTLLVPIGEWAEPMQTATGFEGRDPSECGGDDNQQCVREVIDHHNQQVDEILQAVVSLADPTETLIRIQNQHFFPTNASPEAQDILYPYFADVNTHLQEDADQYGIPVADVFRDFAGPDGTRNAEEDGLISSDHHHPSLTGGQRIAELIGNLGYDPAP